MSVGADDFTSSGTIARAMSRGFNLLVDAGAARAGQIHYLVIRLADGLRAEGFVDCFVNTRNCGVISASFILPGATNVSGKIEGILHWDGSMGVLNASWVLPKG